MSIRYSMIPREAKSHVTFFEQKAFDMDMLRNTSITYATKERVITSAVRYAMREEQCDQIPRVIGAYWLSMPDRWGNSFLIEVEYARRGYRATFAGRENENKSITWQMYMD